MYSHNRSYYEKERFVSTKPSLLKIDRPRYIDRYKFDVQKPLGFCTFDFFYVQKHIGFWTFERFDLQKLIENGLFIDRMYKNTLVFEHSKDLMFKSYLKIHFLPFRCAKTHWFLNIRNVWCKKTPSGNEHRKARKWGPPARNWGGSSRDESELSGTRGLGSLKLK